MKHQDNCRGLCPVCFKEADERFEKNLLEKRQYKESGRTNTFNVLPAFTPYESRIDGTWISSREQHRAHLKQHGAEEIGTAYDGMIKQLKEAARVGREKEIEVHRHRDNQEVINKWKKETSELINYMRGRL